MKLFKAATAVMALSAFTAIFGLVREAVIAAEFGASVDTDAFYFARDLSLRLPEFLLPAIAGAAIPIFLRAKEDGQGQRFMSTVLVGYVALAGVVAILSFALAPLIVDFLGAGFDEEAADTTVLMLRILAPAVVLTAAAGGLQVLLRAEGWFATSQFPQLFLSLAVIALVVFYADELGVASVAIGLNVAVVLMVLWLGYWAWRAGFRYRSLLGRSDPLMRRFLLLLGPILAGSLLSWMIPIVDKSLASSLPAGAIAALSFGLRPVSVLRRIGISSLVVAALPVLAWQSVHKTAKEVQLSVERMLGVVVFALTPVTVMMFIMRDQVIEILYERGAFTSAATGVTADVFGAVVIGLVPMGLAEAASAVFNAKENTKVPALYGAGVNLGVKLALSPLLIIPFGVTGLAMSTTLMYTISAVIMLVLMKRRLVEVRLGRLTRTIFRALIATVVAGAAVFAVTAWFESALVILVVGGLAGSTVFIALAHSLDIEELEFFRRKLADLVRRVRHGRQRTGMGS